MNRLAQIAEARIRGRMLDKPLSGPGGYLDKGIHDVTIVEVDTSQLGSGGYVEFLFESPTGAKHRQRVWLLCRDKDEYSGPLIAVVNALFQDPNVYYSLDEQMAEEELQGPTLETFRGMALALEVDYTPGYLVTQAQDKYMIVDAHSGAARDKRLFESVADARAAAIARGFNRAFRQVKRYKAGSDGTLVDNRARYDAAIKGLSHSSQSGGHPRQLFSIYSLRDATGTR